MAAPYAHPAYGYPTPYLWPYFQPQVVSPFIPPQQFPPSPRSPPTRHVRFADDEDELYRTGRSRPPSWHAGMPGTTPAPNPAPFPSPPMYYTPLPPMVPLQPPPVHTHHRRYSDGVLPQPTWVQVPTWMTVYTQVPPQPQPQPQLHPLLSAEGGREPPLFFDMSFYAYEPRHITSTNSTGTILTSEERNQTATYPGVTRMVITCDELPEWTVTLEPHRERPSNSGYLAVPTYDAPATVAPITVNDVLVAIHRMMQRQITHSEYYQLSKDRATAVARAYTRRCRTFPHSAGIRGEPRSQACGLPGEQVYVQGSCSSAWRTGL